MLPQCQGPVWAINDLSPCFQRNVLQVTLPLAACALSLLLIILGLTGRYITRKSITYQVLSTDNSYNEVHNGRESELDTMLSQAVPNKEVQTVANRPWVQVASIALELAALNGQVALYVPILTTHYWGHHGTLPAITGLLTWGYILFLVVVRLLSSTVDLALYRRLWAHTAVLYSAQLLFNIIQFRSAVIYPRSKRSVILSSIQFSLNTLLLLIALTTRRSNKPILVQREEALETRQHSRPSLLSLATFSWLDPLVWKGFQRPLELEDVYDLDLSQKATTALTDFRKRSAKGSLAWRLFLHFRAAILVQGLWTIFASLFIFAPSLLVKAILEYVENPRSATPHAAWLYAILLFCSATAQGVADNQALFIGRQMGVKAKAIIIGEIYAKTLRRKAGAYMGGVRNAAHQPAPENAKPKAKSTLPSGQRTKTSGKDNVKTGQQKPKSNSREAVIQADVGTIMNLMAIDAFKVSQVGAYLHFLWAGMPVQIVIAITVLYSIMGFSAFAGIALMILMLPINILIARQFAHVQKEVLKGTDARIRATNEVLQNIRIIKYFAWEQRFQDTIDEKRKAEIKSLRQRYIIFATATTAWYGTPILITFLSFFLYTVIAKKPLTPSIAFPALSTFSLLRAPLDRLAKIVSHVQESKVSLDRVENYLNEEETSKYNQLHDSSLSGGPAKIALEKATLTWATARPSPQGYSSEDVDAFQLIDIHIHFPIGCLSIITGPTGSGKSSLLMGLLGEMRLIRGRIYLPGGMCYRADLPVDPETGLIESVAYCAQEAWLINNTVKENIIFASPYDEKRYAAVLEACALDRDLEILDAGDQTLVGEKGVSLSGGQKQRISLARAIYSSARHLLLDDCISAVDTHTAKHIFGQALTGPLMTHRSCILVTHNVSLAAPRADYIVVLNHGRVAVQGHPDEVGATGNRHEFPTSPPEPQDKSNGVSRPAQREMDSGDGGLNTNGIANVVVNGSVLSQQEDTRSRMKECKAVGSIKWSTIIIYLRSMGSWGYWFSAVSVFWAQQLTSALTNFWIRQWANSYHGSNPQTRISVSNHVMAGDVKHPPALRFSSVMGMSNFGLFQPDTPSSVPGTDRDVNPGYYLAMYALVGFLYVTISLGQEVVLFWGSLRASRKIHDHLLKAVMHAKFRFFDSTPLGQLMNRFSKDVESVDQEVALSVVSMLHCLASVLVIIIIISVITPGFLTAGVFITAVYAAIGTTYLNPSRDLKRLESVQRSPLYQQFGETLHGIVTIRAYSDRLRLVVENHNHINAYNRPHLYLCAIDCWLALRMNWAGALVSFLSAAFVLTNIGKIDAGAAGLSLTYAVTFTENILSLVRLFSEVQQNMNSVERVRQYLAVDQEEAAVIPGSCPETGWPRQGAVEFRNYTTRYCRGLDAVLKDVSFTVQPGEKVGVVGRTGAGKSTLALALFRGLEAEKGQILIDQVDIGSIGLRDLRESITIVPQDPTLFSGTIRSNLDPFSLFNDQEIITALRRVHLVGCSTSDTAIPATSSTVTAVGADDDGVDGGAVSVPGNKNIFYNLDSPVLESGTNLSQGQRQLLCLARALLKRPRILMIDEATASIDYATDAKIQETLRELRGSTIITVAHRLWTIIDYDKVLVLDQGRVIEFDHPWNLLTREDSVFRSMCNTSGNMKVLLDEAQRAWANTRLVVDS